MIWEIIQIDVATHANIGALHFTATTLLFLARIISYFIKFQIFISSVYFTICINFTDLLLCPKTNRSSSIGMLVVYYESFKRYSWQEALKLEPPSLPSYIDFLRFLYKLFNL